MFENYWADVYASRCGGLGLNLQTPDTLKTAPDITSSLAQNYCGCLHCIYSLPIIYFLDQNRIYVLVSHTVGPLALR